MAVLFCRDELVQGYLSPIDVSRQTVELREKFDTQVIEGEFSPTRVGRRVYSCFKIGVVPTIF